MIAPSSLDFRRAMAQFATGVTVVTTRSAGRDYGLTVNAFCSVSLAPPLVLVSLDLRSQTWAALRQAGVFAVNILAAEQDELGRRFARKDAKSFADIPLQRGATGAPLFTEALAAIECRRAADYPGGDHQLVLGEVLGIAIRDEAAPLLYFRAAFGALTDA